MTADLVESIRKNQAILFVGAGVSKGLGLPSWKELIAKMGDDLDYDKDIFSTFGDYLALAEYYMLQSGSLGPLRSWMDRSWHKDESRIAESEVHKLIVELNFPIIYTTNYDRWLELAFQHYGKNYSKIINVGDIPNIESGKTQIIKFHGDFDDDSSLVLTESQYFERLNFESPLDIKLRSDSLGRTILFIGYSLTDVNIRYLLYKLNKLWECSGYHKFQPKSYLFSSRPNAIQEEVLRARNIEMIFSKIDDPGEALIAFLQDLSLQAFGRDK
jgi:SIR2-like domain